MATIPNPAAMLAPALPFPLESGQLLAFRGGDGPGYAQFGGISVGGSVGARVVSDSIPRIINRSVPVPLQVGGFAPAAIAQAAAGLLLSLIHI